MNHVRTTEGEEKKFLFWIYGRPDRGRDVSSPGFVPENNEIRFGQPYTK